MNISEVLKNNNVSIRKVIESNPNMFFTIPFDLINKTYSVEEQHNFINKNSHLPYQCELLSNMLAAETVVDPEFFIKTFMPMTYWANDKSKIMEFINNHPDCKKIMIMMLEYSDKYRDKISNILDNFYKTFNLLNLHFDNDLYHALATNDFIMCSDQNYEWWMEKESNKTMIESSAFTYIQLHVIKDLKKQKIFNPNFYAVPETLVELLTTEQVEILVRDVFRFFDDVSTDQKEYLNTMLSAIAHKNSNIKHSLFQTLADDFSLTVPSIIESNEKYAKEVAEESKIEPNYEDPFQHARIQNWNKIRGNEEVVKKLIKEACKVENVLKDEHNLSFLLTYVDVTDVPAELFANLANNHLNFLVRSCNHIREWQINSLLDEYNGDVKNRSHVMNVVFELLTENSAVRFVIDNSHPEYIDYVLKYNYEVGLDMIGSILSKNKYDDLVENIS